MVLKESFSGSQSLFSPSIKFSKQLQHKNRMLLFTSKPNGTDLVQVHQQQREKGLK